jgi:hypothetical protein
MEHTTELTTKELDTVAGCAFRGIVSTDFSAS